MITELHDLEMSVSFRSVNGWSGTIEKIVKVLLARANVLVCVDSYADVDEDELPVSTSQGIFRVLRLGRVLTGDGWH